MELSLERRNLCNDENITFVNHSLFLASKKIASPGLSGNMEVSMEFKSSEEDGTSGNIVNYFNKAERFHDFPLFGKVSHVLQTTFHPLHQVSSLVHFRR